MSRPPSNAQRPGEPFVTGFALACTQVTLGFVAMRGLSASAAAWFVVVLCWLLGGMLAARWAEPQQVAKEPAPGEPLERALSLLMPILLGLSALATEHAPFARLPQLLLMAAALCAGGYGGLFLARRGQRVPSPAALFFHENNGFVLGILTASVLLLLAAPLLVPVTLLSQWLARSLGRQGSPLLPAVSIGALGTVLQLCFRFGSDPQWDALMTATVLHHGQAAPLADWLFFAHPLIIPLTAPLLLLTEDPLHAVLLREALCLGGNLALLYLAARALTPPTGQRALTAAFACLGYLLARGRWQLVLCGQEKESMQLASSLFLLLYLDHRGLIDLGIPAFSRLPCRVQQLLLGGLLALATVVHLISGLLFVWLLVDLLLHRPRRDLLRGQLRIVLTAAALLAPFLLWLAIGPGHVRSVAGLFRFYLEYHLSGEFLSVPHSLTQRLLDCYHGLRTWLLGEHRAPVSAWEAGLCGLGALWLGQRALRSLPIVGARLVAWPLLLLGHFFFFEPQNPESWAPSSLCLLLLGSVGLLSGTAWLTLRRTLAAVLIALLGFGLGHSQRAAAAQADRVAAYLNLAERPTMPLKDLVLWLDLWLPQDAEILVEDRLLLSYFQLYTERTPQVQAYLGKTPEALQQTEHLTHLSLRHYTPTRSINDMEQAIAQGRPVYLLSTEAASPSAQKLPADELYLSRLSPPSPRPAPSPDALLSQDLTLTSAKPVNPSVYQLTLQRSPCPDADGGNACSLTAKWKPLGPLASEQQEGIEGNNAPRCELAARHIDRFLWPDAPERQLVPEVVVRAFHRSVACDRACRNVPRIIDADIPATFPEHNDHLVIGALTDWIDDADRPLRFHGELWNPERFRIDPDYRRAIADLWTFLTLISHGDANYADNFLWQPLAPVRIYSIDNGRSLDGLPYYSEDADPDWQPLRDLAPQRPFLPALSAQTLRRLAALPHSALAQQLYLVAAVDLRSGRAVPSPHTEPRLRRFASKPLATQPGLTALGPGRFLTPASESDGPWLLLGLTEQGVADLLARAQALQDTAQATRIPLFE